MHLAFGHRGAKSAGVEALLQVFDKITPAPFGSAHAPLEDDHQENEFRKDLLTLGMHIRHILPPSEID